MDDMDSLTEQLRRELAISEARLQAANERVTALQQVDAGMTSVAEGDEAGGSSETASPTFGGIVVSSDVPHLIDDLQNHEGGDNEAPDRSNAPNNSGGGGGGGGAERSKVDGAKDSPNDAASPAEAANSSFCTPPHSPNRVEGPKRTDPFTGLSYTNKVQFYSGMEYALQATALYQKQLRDASLLFSKFRPLNFVVTNQRGERGVEKLRAIFEPLPADSEARSLFLHFRVANSAIVNAYAQFGFSLAHTLALRGEPDMLRYLLSLGARGYERDLTGRMPLHVLAGVKTKKEGHIEVCRMLIDHMAQNFGAKPLGPNAPVDNAGLTPCGWLQGSNRSAVHDMLHQPGDLSVSKALRRQPGGADAQHVGRGEFSSYAEANVPGWKYTMEDEFVAHPETLFPDGRGTCDIYAVFDGHGGSEVAKFCKTHLLEKLLEAPSFRSHSQAASDLPAALDFACRNLDAAIVARPELHAAGSTGAIVVVTEKQIIVANVGDCRVVLEQRQQGEGWEEGAEIAVSVALSTDHTTRNPRELERLRSVGAELTPEQDRVIFYAHDDPSDASATTKKMVEPTRTFGNGHSKVRRRSGSQGGGEEPTPASNHALTAAPEITVHDRTDADRFIVIACDGIWDVMSNDDVGALLRLQFDNNGTSGGAGSSSVDATRDTAKLLDTSREILTSCLERGSGDNMTVLVVGLAPATTSELKKDLFSNWDN